MLLCACSGSNKGPDGAGGSSALSSEGGGGGTLGSMGFTSGAFVEGGAASVECAGGGCAGALGGATEGSAGGGAGGTRGFTCCARSGLTAVSNTNPRRIQV